MMLSELIVHRGMGGNSIVSNNEKKESLTKQEISDILKYGAENLFRDDEEGQGNNLACFRLVVMHVIEIEIIIYYYPHMPISNVWIYRLLFVCVLNLCVCVFVLLLISAPRIKLTASNFAWRFVGVQGRESPIFVNFAPPEAPSEAQNRLNWRVCGPRPSACKHYM